MNDVSMFNFTNFPKELINHHCLIASPKNVLLS